MRAAVTGFESELAHHPGCPFRELGGMSNRGILQSRDGRDMKEEGTHKRGYKAEEGQAK
jgi:hypothetical protein